MTIEELDIVVPDYVNRLLSNVASRTGREIEDVALFFLLKKAVHAHANLPSDSQRDQCQNKTETLIN